MTCSSTARAEFLASLENSFEVVHAADAVTAV
jgi:hypothetical protein